MFIYFNTKYEYIYLNLITNVFRYDEENSNNTL